MRLAPLSKSFPTRVLKKPVLDASPSMPTDGASPNIHSLMGVSFLLHFVLLASHPIAASPCVSTVARSTCAYSPAEFPCLHTRPQTVPPRAHAFHGISVHRPSVNTSNVALHVHQHSRQQQQRPSAHKRSRTDLLRQRHNPHTAVASCAAAGQSETSLQLYHS